MKCKHPNVFARRWIAEQWIVLLGDSRDADARRCGSCGMWISLGHSDETDERVAVEIEAAERSLAWAPLDFANQDTRDGWYCHRDGCAPNLDNRQSWVGYLAREICTHDGERAA